MDSKVSYYKSVFDHEFSEGFHFPEYQGRQFYYSFNVYHRRSHYGAILGDVLRSI